MPAGLQHDHDNVFRIDIQGTLHKHDLDRCGQEIAGEIVRFGRVRLLIVLDRFDGWDAMDNWKDLTFYVRYGDAIDRIAIVGDERWRSLALMFANADLRRGPVEYFTSDAVAEARTWLNGGAA
jgi:hypothetical protein